MTLRLRFSHFTANDKLRFAVNGFTLLVCPYLGLEICGWSTSILGEKLSSKLPSFFIGLKKASDTINHEINFKKTLNTALTKMP